MPRLANKFKTFQIERDSERIENESLLGSWFHNTSIFSHRLIGWLPWDIILTCIQSYDDWSPKNLRKVVKSFNDLYRCKFTCQCTWQSVKLISTIISSLTQFTVAILEALHYQNFHSPKGWRLHTHQSNQPNVRLTLTRLLLRYACFTSYNPRYVWMH